MRYVGAVSSRELAIDVLHHHHRAVDENAEVDRADRQQVRRNVPQVETDERDQQRQRHGDSDDQPRAQS